MKKREKLKLQWYREGIYSNSGYSDEARTFIDALAESGMDIFVVGNNKNDNGKYKIKNRINPDIPVVYHTYNHGSYKLNKNQYSICRTMFEGSIIPKCWVYNFNQMDEIWVPNVFNAKVFEKSGVIKEKLFIIPSPLDSTFSDDTSIYPIKTKKKFKILSVFNYSVRWRKGLDILLKSYIEEFSKNDDVCLILKTNVTIQDLKDEYKLTDDIPEIIIINDYLNRKDLLSLYRTVNCFVLPTRGEGIGRPFMDAMMTSTPVIGTGWSGNTDFMDESNSYLIDYELNYIDQKYYLKFPGFYGGQWAEPKLNDLKRKLRSVFEKKDISNKKVRFAKQNIKKYNDNIVAKKIIKRLENPLSINKICQKNIFERLMPVYYPETNIENVYEKSENDFLKKIESVLIYGTGVFSEIVFKYITNFKNIKNVIFTDKEYKSFFDKPFVDIKKLSNESINYEIIIIAANRDYLPSIYNRLVSNVNNMPIYIYI